MSCCREFEDSLWEAAETGAVKPELHEHMKVCDRCARSLEALKSAQSGFAVLSRVDAPDPRAAVRARLATPARRSRWIPALAGAFAAACAIIILALSQIRTPTPAKIAIEAVKPPKQVSAPDNGRSTVVPRVKTVQQTDQDDLAIRRNNPRPEPQPMRHAGRAVPRQQTGTAHTHTTPRTVDAELSVDKPCP